MPPTSSKLLAEQRPHSICKHTLTPSLANPDNVDAAAIKHRKLEAVLCQQGRLSVEVILNNVDDLPPPNYPPQKASTILKVADSSDNESMGNADLYANDGSSVSDNGACDSNGEEVMDLDGEDEVDLDGEEMDGDLEDKEESEDEELGECSNIIH